MTELRPYQQRVIAQLRASPARRKLLVAPTRSGKTVIAAELIRSMPETPTLFLAHRRELVHHAANKLAEFGIEAGIILAGEPTDREARVQVASIQTLHARHRRGAMQLPPAGLVVVDECHHARARTYRALLDRYPAATILGMTATPCRGDGRGLGNVFDVLIQCPQVLELIDLDYLVPTRVYAPTTPDLRGVHVRMGDYVEKELAQAVDRPGLVGDIVTHWHRLAERRKTVVFATSVAHSIHLCDAFRKSYVKAEHIDGETPKDERDEILRRLSNGNIELVTNCMVLTEGWDQPDIGCCVLARPTKHMGLYRQMVGRVITPSLGKVHALVLDHAGAVFQHGFIEEPVEWTLDVDRRAESRVHTARGKGGAASRLLACTQCSAIRTAGKPCGVCGHMPRRPGQDVETLEGDLARVAHTGRLHPNQYSHEQRQEFHRGLAFIAQERGYKPGWAAHKFKERFGHWPLERWVEPGPPSPEVLAWERHCRIKFAKAMQKAGADG